MDTNNTNETGEIAGDSSVPSVGRMSEETRLLAISFGLALKQAVGTDTGSLGLTYAGTESVEGVYRPKFAVVLSYGRLRLGAVGSCAACMGRILRRVLCGEMLLALSGASAAGAQLARAQLRADAFARSPKCVSGVPDVALLEQPRDTPSPAPTEAEKSDHDEKNEGDRWDGLN